MLSDPIMLYPLVIKQPQSHIESGPTPPVPTEATAFLRTHQMPLDPLSHPVFNISKTPAGGLSQKFVLKFILPTTFPSYLKGFSAAALLPAIWPKAQASG